MVRQSLNGKGFGGLGKDLQRTTRDRINDAKQNFKSDMRQWTDEVRELNVPVGDPKKKREEMPSPYHPGLLKESTSLEFDEGRDYIKATISIGDNAMVDYARYAAANGAEFWKGQNEAVERIEQGLAHPDAKPEEL